MKNKAPVPSLDDHELDELILKVLSGGRFGLPANKIHKELPPSYRRSAKHITARLDDLCASFRVHAWEPPPGKSKNPPAIARVALKVNEKLESRIILEQNSAETLLGNGDLLFKDLGPPTRLQCPLISDEDLKRAARC